MKALDPDRPDSGVKYEHTDVVYWDDVRKVLVIPIRYKEGIRDGTLQFTEDKRDE